jgi:hypothetical protein
VVLIQETKCDKMTMIQIAKKIWKNCEVEVVDLEGALGRLDILWDPMKCHLELFSILPRILTMSYAEIGSQSQGFISNGYGPLTPQLKREFLESLNQIGTTL